MDNSIPEEATINDYIIDEAEDQFQQIELEVAPNTREGPSCPTILELRARYDAMCKSLLPTEASDSDSSENTESGRIRAIEREIKKQLSSMTSTDLSYRSRLPINKPSVLDEDEEIAMSKKQPVFLKKDFFKFQQSSDSAASADIIENCPPPKPPQNENYLNFTSDGITYSFPFQNNK
ncbi:hypothetical protein DMENIID0001_159930 [Sergentomyia squamirostris]